MLASDGSQAPSSGLEKVVDVVALKVNAVPLVMLVALVVAFAVGISRALPVTFTNFNVPLVRPALSTAVPVLVLVPWYTQTELDIIPVPPSLFPITIVLSCGNGLAKAFSHAPTPVKPEPFVEILNLPKM